MYLLTLVFKYFFKKDNWNLLSKVDILLVDHDGHRSYNWEGKMYAPLIDSFQDSFDSCKFNFLTIAEPYSKITGSKAYGNVVDFNGSFARVSVFRQFKLLFKKEKYPGQFGYTRVWDDILEKTNPKLIVSIMPAESLCFASRGRGILIADLQHGVIADKHPWYGESFKKNIDKTVLPDYYLCWNQESANVLLKWTLQKRIQVLVIGNPWFIRFKEMQNSNSFDQNKQLCSFKNFNDLPTILITLGWGFLHFNTEYFTKKYSKKILFEQEAGFSLGLLSVIKENHHLYNWKIRLHPVQMNGLEFKVVNRFLLDNLSGYQNIDWIECSKLPLPFVLGNIDLHITFCSTIVSEAALFGVKSAILVPDPTPEDWLESYFENERSSGVASFVINNHTEISNWLSSNLYSRNNSYQIVENDSDYFEFIGSVNSFLKSENISISI